MKSIITISLLFLISCSSLDLYDSYEGSKINLDKNEAVELLVVLNNPLDSKLEFNEKQIETIYEMCQAAGFATYSPTIISELEYNTDFLSNSKFKYTFVFHYTHNQEFTDYILVRNKQDELILNFSILDSAKVNPIYTRKITAVRTNRTGILTVLGVGSSFAIKDDKAKIGAAVGGLAIDVLSSVIINSKDYTELNELALEEIYNSIK